MVVVSTSSGELADTLRPDCTTIYFIRHGQIQANVDHVWHGSTNSDLTPLGEEQAIALGGYLSESQVRLSALYTSPLKRTSRTAELVGHALDLEPKPVPELVEYGVGDYEGTAYETLLEWGFFSKIEEDHHYAPPGGESLYQVVSRMVDSIHKLAACHRGSEIAIVSHGAAMGAAFSKMLDGVLFPFHKYHMDNTAMSKFVIAEKPELIYFNKSDHLLIAT